MEAYNKTDLTPISQTQNGKYIELQFSDPQLTSIFVNLKILAYKDYAEVELTYKPNRITSLSPNPTTGQVEVEYKINTGESAYLAVTSIENPNISNNYILDTEDSAFDLNIDNLSAGIYSVALIVNGQIVDTKNLIKN